MRVLVCGGRNFDDADRLFNALDALHASERIHIIIHGDATGADALAEAWASLRKIACATYPVTPADWKAYGASAGAIRNQQMLSIGKPDRVVAFSGGRGTADMVARAEQAGVEVLKR